MAPSFDPSLPRLSELLAPPVSPAKVAALIGRDRSFVHRLRHGQPLRDYSLIALMAQALRESPDRLRAIVENDARRVRAKRQQKGRGRAA